MKHVFIGLIALIAFYACNNSNAGTSQHAEIVPDSVYTYASFVRLDGQATHDLVIKYYRDTVKNIVVDSSKANRTIKQVRGVDSFYLHRLVVTVVDSTKKPLRNMAGQDSTISKWFPTIKKYLKDFGSTDSLKSLKPILF